MAQAGLSPPHSPSSASGRSSHSSVSARYSHEESTSRMYSHSHSAVSDFSVPPLSDPPPPSFSTLSRAKSSSGSRGQFVAAHRAGSSNNRSVELSSDKPTMQWTTATLSRSTKRAQPVPPPKTNRQMRRSMSSGHVAMLQAKAKAEAAATANRWSPPVKAGRGRSSAGSRGGARVGAARRGGAPQSPPTRALGRSVDSSSSAGSTPPTPPHRAPQVAGKPSPRRSDSTDSSLSPRSSPSAGNLKSAAALAMQLRQRTGIGGKSRESLAYQSMPLPSLPAHGQSDIDSDRVENPLKQVPLPDPAAAKPDSLTSLYDDLDDNNKGNDKDDDDDDDESSSDIPVTLLE